MAKSKSGMVAKPTKVTARVSRHGIASKGDAFFPKSPIEHRFETVGNVGSNPQNDTADDIISLQNQTVSKMRSGAMRKK